MTWNLLSNESVKVIESQIYRVSGYVKYLEKKYMELGYDRVALARVFYQEI